MKIDLCSCDPSHGKVCGCGKPMCQQCCFAAHPTCPCSCPGCTPDPSWTQRYPHTCQPACDCPLDPHHRWNCALTPVWAQTMRDLDCNPWTVVRDAQVPCHCIEHSCPGGSCPCEWQLREAEKR